MEHETKGGSIIPPELETTTCSPLLKPKFLQWCRRSARIRSKSEGGFEVLPVELMIDILLRLAFRDLLRMKSVSKSLCDLISNPEFADVHLKWSLESGTKCSLLVFQNLDSCYSMEMEMLEKSDLKRKVNLRFARSIQLLGSCNGLLCVRKGRSDAILHNPSTRDCYKLPASPVGAALSIFVPRGVDHFYHRLNYGFGYDSACSDYKVVKIFTFYCEMRHVAFAFGAMIYSLKMNSWRKIEPPPSNIGELESDCGVLCNDALHWVYRAKDGSTGGLGIIGFELHSETFHQVPLPDHSSEFDNISLGILGGHLCASSSPLVGAHAWFERRDFCSWVMNEYGVKDSWTVLFEFPHLIKFITQMRPLVYSKSGNEVLVDVNCSRFLWFDFRKREFKSLISCYHSATVICMQSLVSPQKWKSASMIHLNDPVN